MLRNSVENGNIPAECLSKLELFPFSCMNVAKEMPFGRSFEDEVEDLKGAHVFIEDAVWRAVCNQDVQILGDVLIGNQRIPVNGAYDYSVAILNGILKYGDSSCFKPFDDITRLAQIKRQFMIPRNEDLPLGRQG